MGRTFCPKCGNFNFGYDLRAKIQRCYSVKCDYVLVGRKYGEGLSENPFSKPETYGLESKENKEMDNYD